MNKKLIALAVAGASLAPAAMAQTANPVTLYGRIWVMAESVEASGGVASIARRNRVSDQSSLLGVRGTEDLGGGLKAVFQLETGFAPDANMTTFATRNSGVGLQGGFGTIMLGRWDTPFKTTQTAVDAFGDNALGDITGATMNGGNFSRREQNNIQYWSPSWGGFEFRAQYTANEGKAANVNPYVYGGSVAWTRGNFYAAIAYEQHRDLNGATPTQGNKEEGTGIAASYRMGNLKFSGQYGEYKETNLSKQKSYYLGLEWFVGKHVFLGTFQNAKDGVAAGASAECDMYSFGYQYVFSRRTMFGVNYTEVKNDSGNLCNFGSNALTITGNQDPKGFAAGFRHTF
ncbi:porin [Usitatibacter palustris]|uniref:Outer membrane porin protein 32 n=1 Tax=Usitatibacter palustris TaxID=2732487 RepID=A0A6M4H2H0_9PROT|nr:porin [Usitatibacter palustris]QJR13696.1 Outer membrane porin protein 32 [Usitatibacter palustris]